VSLTTVFKQAASGNYRIAFVLTEDSVTGTTSKYAQSNAYSGGGSGVMGGFEILPNPVPANKMVYDHVGRVISPNFAGLPNAFSATINANDSFTHNFRVAIDPTWNTSRMHIIGILIDPSGKVDNGSIVGFSQAIQHGYVTGTAVTGITSLTPGSTVLQVYPNPSENIFNIEIPVELSTAKEMMIYDMQGQLIQSENISGKSNLTINSQSWAPGIYIGVINVNGTSVKVKLVKQ
jgi:hypothetical protein